ncbi:MAG: DUF885 domain-containing protein, partial [Burkholderiaceae bacterium]|nr:DUF885 domain-containing protein [Burkholderiaceae bacterium]
SGMRRLAAVSYLPAAIALSGSRRHSALDPLAGQFLTALWRLDPESAIAAGKYDTAASLRIPDAAGRAEQLAFAEAWLARLNKLDARQLSPRQRIDHALLSNKLNGDRWRLGALREFEWNPALYNVAGPIERILHTEYAAQPQRLRTLLRRIADVPAYYAAARTSIVNPTREHTRLAIAQNAGAVQLLGELERVAQASILSPTEKQLYTQRTGAARAAVDAYVAWLGELDNGVDNGKNDARSFRLGKELYEQKFAYELQSGASGAQTYQKAQTARDLLLAEMGALADELWSKTMGEAPQPSDRNEKIGKVIEQLSARHVARADFLPEIRRQIPLLRDWVNSRQLLSLDPKLTPVVRETPPHQRGLAFTALDASGPYRPQGRSYYNITPLDAEPPEQAEAKLREYNQWTLPLSTMHDTIPGLYAQRSYANRSLSVVKAVFGGAAMRDGWAVYGERMMLESGYGENTPEMRLMAAKRQLRAITDALLDYGVHALGMTQEQALEMLTRQAFQNPREAAEKWRRAQLTSVQPSAGFAGYSEIMEWREQRKQAQGGQFTPQAFHQQLLGQGGAPLRLIKEQ